MRKTALLLLLTLNVLALRAWAADSAGEVVNDSASHLLSDDYRNEKFMVKLGTTSYAYEEPSFAKIHGQLFTIETGFRNKIGTAPIPMWYGGNVSYAIGKDTYDGGVVDKLGNVTPESVSSRDQIFMLEGYYGFSFFDNGVQMMDLYSGLGIWSLTNKIDGVGSYTRDVLYIYLPIGIRYTVRASPAFKFNIGAQYDVFLLGNVSNHFSDINSNADDGDNTQTSGGGYKLNAAGEFKMQKWSLFLEAYYQAWDIGQSNTSYANGRIFYEPKNTTRMLGFNIGGRF